jgi:hypothetical protein
MATTYNPPQQKILPPPLGGDGTIYGNSNAISLNNAIAVNKVKFGGSKKHKKIRRVTLTPALIIIGGKYKKQLKGGSTSAPATITVPPIQLPFKDHGNMINDNIINSIKLDATLKANSEYDHLVGKTGGRKIKGGWPKWGCMSGGKKSKRKYRNKCRKTKKCCIRKR